MCVSSKEMQDEMVNSHFLGTCLADRDVLIPATITQLPQTPVALRKPAGPPHLLYSIVMPSYPTFELSELTVI